MNKVSNAIKLTLEEYGPIIEASVPVYIDKAPAKKEPPYIIISMMSGRNEYAQQQQEVIPLTYLVKGITQHGSGALGDRIQGWIKAALNFQQFTIDGMRLLKCWQTQIIHYPEPVGGGENYHNGGLFSVWVA